MTPSDFRPIRAQVLPFLFLCSVLLSGCVASITTHQFMWQGSDALLSQRDFDYVKTGVTGKAYTEYEVYRSGGFVKDGLVADAKEDLRRQHPLGRNEAYANVSIDVLNTRTGHMTNQGLVEHKIRLTVVISADIVRLGGYATAGGTAIEMGGSLAALPTPDLSEPPEAGGSLESWSETPSSSEPRAFGSVLWPLKGDEVFITYRNQVLRGTVLEAGTDYHHIQYNNGKKEKSNWIFESRIFRTEEEAKLKLNGGE